MAANTRALPVMATSINGTFMAAEFTTTKTSGEELSSTAESFPLFEFENSAVYFKSLNFSR